MGLLMLSNTCKTNKNSHGGDILIMIIVDFGVMPCKLGFLLIVYPNASYREFKLCRKYDNLMPRTILEIIRAIALLSNFDLSTPNVPIKVSILVPK